MKFYKCPWLDLYIGHCSCVYVPLTFWAKGHCLFFTMNKSKLQLLLVETKIYSFIHCICKDALSTYLFG